MTDRLPALPPSDDMIDRVAREVAAQIAGHIEWAYPDIVHAVPWESFKRSMQGVTRNAMAEAARAAEEGTLDRCLRDMRARRLDASRAAQAMRAMREKNIDGA